MTIGSIAVIVSGPVPRIARATAGCASRAGSSDGAAGKGVSPASAFCASATAPVAAADFRQEFTSSHHTPSRHSATSLVLRPSVPPPPIRTRTAARAESRAPHRWW